MGLAPGDTLSPVLGALQKYRRSAAPDGPASAAAIPSFATSNASEPGFASQATDELNTVRKRNAPVLTRVGKYFDDSLIIPPRGSNQPAPPLDGEQEQADMRALDARLSGSGDIKDAVALYNARKSRRQKATYDRA
jgi:hypothetical protein